MANPVQKPWAILLCKFSDDNNDPSKTRIMDLATQWRATKGAAFAAANLNPSWDTDARTILDLYQTFFTITGIFTSNVVQYFDTMSHGLVDVTGNQVFPVTLNLTAAQGAALAANPGGLAYQNAMFQQAKAALLIQYNVDWKNFPGGVAVSFQSPDYGGQGSTNYDGGPGVFADIRYVKNNGTQRWGHEMGHGFGLDHSRTDGQFTSNCTGGDPSDYTDPWDIMSIACAFSAPDPSYGLMGPGMNAWNMRNMHGLDETRVWKGLQIGNFSQTITLNALHFRNQAGFLAAELPGIGGDSTYLIEFRVPRFWDSAIGSPVVIVHRFSANHSYIMKGTNGQKGLIAGDVFEKNAGAFVRVKVNSIDPVGLTATIKVCYNIGAPAPLNKRSVKILFDHIILRKPCAPKVPVAGENSLFSFVVSGVFCLEVSNVLWSVSGTTPVSGQLNNGNSFSIVTPDPSVSVTVSVMVILEDGTILNDSYTFNSISEEAAQWMEFLCGFRLPTYQLRPIPWWEWDPEMIAEIAGIYSRQQLGEIGQRLEKTLQTVHALYNSSK